MTSLRGSLLIATPQLQDPNFMQSVVFMIEHDQEGAFGLILNRPMQLTMQQLWQQLESSDCPLDAFVRSGGPVSGPLLALHPFAQFSDREIMTGVHLTSDREPLQNLLRQGKPPVHLYIGYAGWGKEQLDGELEVGGWLTLPATPKIIFAEETDDLWHNAIRKSGEQFWEQSLGIQGFPSDPAAN